MRCSTISFVCCLLLMSPFVKAQSNVWDSLNKRRLTINQNHLYVLGSWAAANIVQGSISATNTTGSTRYLHQMNAYWNTVNLAIAGLGIWALKMQLRQKITPADLLQEQKTVEKLLLLNSGLDVAYIMTGLYMKEKGLRLQNDRNIGFGNSLVIQGSFLLVLDLVQYFAHQKNGKAIYDQAKKVQWGVGANGLGLTYRL
jgi:hypothetical protein